MPEHLTQPKEGEVGGRPSYKKNAPAAVRKAREASLSVKCARLFNVLPRDLRDTNTGTVDQFKARLDDWLATVPDQPTIEGRQRAASTNSLLDQVILLPANQFYSSQHLVDGTVEKP